MVFLIQSTVQKPSVEKFSRGENSVPHNGSFPAFFPPRSFSRQSHYGHPADAKIGHDFWPRGNTRGVGGFLSLCPDGDTL